MLVLYVAFSGNHLLHWIKFTVHIYRSVCNQHLVMKRNENSNWTHCEDELLFQNLVKEKMIKTEYSAH